MISSAALPNVTLRKPPIPGPDRAASSSVARPISAAVGMIPAAAQKKMTVASAWKTNSSRTASRMKGVRRYGQPCAEKRKRLTRPSIYRRGTTEAPAEPGPRASPWI